MKEMRKIKNFVKTLAKSGVLDWVEKLDKKFPQAEVYLVGGAVRDAVLNRQDQEDYDFVVRKVPMKKLEEVLNQLGWVEKLGKSFGVLKFKPRKVASLPRGAALDIALPRKEMSTSQGGYKDFKVKFDKDLNLEQDLLRRDFTINAIALKLDEKLEIIDPFNGLDDIKNKIIKCVGKPQERLSEDYTRILRAVRFACQLDFNIDAKTKTAIKKLVPHLNDRVKSPSVTTRHGKDEKGEWISPREVIAKELLKAFAEDYMQAIKLFDELNLFKVLMPEVLTMKKCEQPKNYHTEGDVWQHTMLALEKINSSEFRRFEKKLDRILITENTENTKTRKHNANEANKERLELILAVFFHDLGKPYTIQTPKKDGTDRIRFNDHDNVGADLAHQICERLKLSAPEKLGVDCDNVAWLVRKHMVLIHGHPSEFRSTTIEKYFFSGRYPGKNLIKLAYLDSAATITKTGKLEFNLINALLKRIKDMKGLVKQKRVKQSLPEPLLSGDEIMKILKIKSGQRVGKIKNKLRERQLSGEIKTKEQAKKIIKKLLR